MTKKILKIILVLCFLLLLIFAIKMIKESNQGTALPNKKGSPLEQKP